jgi:hypothetical protein
MLGWLLHLDRIPTHSLSYYATRFLWPISDFRIGRIAWGLPGSRRRYTGTLLLVYGVMWKRGWLTAAVATEGRTSVRRLWNYSTSTIITE